MLKPYYKDGATVIEIDRFSGTEIAEKVEKKFSGNIKQISMPISFSSNIQNKNKRQEIFFCFSNIKSEKDFSEETRKALNKLYKYGKIASNTHLIPMKQYERVKIEREFMGIDTSRMRFAITSDPLPATATITETLEFFPCYHDVLPMMMDYFQKPEFYITLLRETAFLNIKYSKNSYHQIPLQHTHGKCWNGVGHPYIHITDDSVHRVRFFKQIEWGNIEFEKESNMF